MRNFYNLILVFYIAVVILLIFMPFSLVFSISKIFSYKKKNSFFNDIQNSKIFTFFNIDFFSLKNFILVFFLLPILPLHKNSAKKIFKTPKNRFIETPKQVGLLLNNHIVGNIRQIIAKSKNSDIDYFFALQPTLFYSGPQTEGDKKILKLRSENQHNGFYFKDYFREFYNILKDTMQNNIEMKEHFEDFSKLFANKKEQRFIDAVHFGDIGQDECAKKLSEIILSREEKKKSNG